MCFNCPGWEPTSYDINDEFADYATYGVISYEWWANPFWSVRMDNPMIRKISVVRRPFT